MKTTLFKTIVYFLFVFSISVQAGEVNTGPVVESGKIMGKLMDKSSREPLGYASVVLVNPIDSSIIKGVITDSSGHYLLKDIPFGQYLLKLSYIGYKPKTVENVDLTWKSRTIDLGTTNMDEDVKSINEVKVTKKRLKGEEKIDRTVFTVNDDIKNASSSGLDLLKHIPGVTVDFQENVTLEGRSDIQYYVDGIMRNKDFVAQLDPEMIDKIEIMTNPSAKYDADISGVINIVMKKVKHHGVNGSVDIEVPHPEKIVLNPRANIEYGNQFMRVYAGDRMHYEKFDGKNITTTTNSDPENAYYYEKNGKGTNSWGNNYLNYGVDFFLSEKTSLNFYGDWRRFKGRERGYSFEESLYYDDVLSDYSVMDKTGHNVGNSYFNSIYLKRALDDDGDELTLEANYYSYKGEDYSEYEMNEFDPFNDFELMSTKDWKEVIDNNRGSVELKVDYTRVDRKFKHELGYHAYNQWIDNFQQLSYNPQPDLFEYSETRQVGYYSLFTKAGKFTLQGGIRLENSTLHFKEYDGNGYTKLLPQFNATYNIKDNQKLKLSFRRQIHRPGAHQLTPFVQFMDSMHMRRGNPELKPSLDNHIELSYSNNFKSNYISPKLYLRYTNNGISDFTIIEDDINMIQQANIVNSYEYGAGLNGAVQPLKKWRINANFTVYNRYIKTDQVTDVHAEEKLSYRFNATNIIMLPRDFTLFMVGYYNSPNIAYQRTFHRDLLFLMGFEKKIGKKAKLEVLYNPFIKEFMYSKIETRYENVNETWKGLLDVNQLFSVSFVYKFNYGKKVKKIERSTEYEKDGNGGSF